MGLVALQYSELTLLFQLMFGIILAIRHGRLWWANCQSWFVSSTALDGVLLCAGDFQSLSMVGADFWSILCQPIAWHNSIWHNNISSIWLSISGRICTWLLSWKPIFATLFILWIFWLHALIWAASFARSLKMNCYSLSNLKSYSFDDCVWFP